MMDSCTYFHLLVIPSRSFHSPPSWSCFVIPHSARVWRAQSQIEITALIANSSFKPRSFLALWLTLMLCSCAAANPSEPQRPHNTNKLEKMCHAAPAFSIWTLRTFGRPLACRHQNNKPISCGQYQRQGVISPNCGRRPPSSEFTETSSSRIYFLSLLGSWMSPNLLVTRRHTRLISEAYLLRKLKNLCRGAAASLSYKYPAWRICCGSNRVLGSLGGRLPRREQFRAEPCMKPLYCLELPVLPERRGQPLFTRSHAYTVCALVYSIVCACMCVFFSVCACSFYGFLS